MSMPPNFSWVVQGLLAASAYPKTEDHYSYMKEQGVSILVSLTQNPADPVKGSVEFDVTHIGMPDFTPPSIKQVDEFVSGVEKAATEGKAIVVHCQMGRGRTGTMCACYLVHKQGLSAEDAITTIRRIRPGSIETAEQEQLVVQYAEHLNSTGHTTT